MLYFILIAGGVGFYLWKKHDDELKAIPPGIRLDPNKQATGFEGEGGGAAKGFGGVAGLTSYSRTYGRSPRDAMNNARVADRGMADLSSHHYPYPANALAQQMKLMGKDGTKKPRYVDEDTNARSLARDLAELPTDVRDYVLSFIIDPSSPADDFIEGAGALVAACDPRSINRANCGFWPSSSALKYDHPFRTVVLDKRVYLESPFMDRARVGQLLSTNNYTIDANGNTIDENGNIIAYANPYAVPIEPVAYDFGTTNVVPMDSAPLVTTTDYTQATMNTLPMDSTSTTTDFNTIPTNSLTSPTSLDANGNTIDVNGNIIAYADPYAVPIEPVNYQFAQPTNVAPADPVYGVPMDPAYVDPYAPIPIEPVNYQLDPNLQPMNAYPAPTNTSTEPALTYDGYNAAPLAPDGYNAAPLAPSSDVMLMDPSYLYMDPTASFNPYNTNPLATPTEPTPISVYYGTQSDPTYTAPYNEGSYTPLDPTVTDTTPTYTPSDLTYTAPSNTGSYTPIDPTVTDTTPTYKTSSPTYSAPSNSGSYTAPEPTATSTPPTYKTSSPTYSAPSNSGSYTPPSGTSAPPSGSSVPTAPWAPPPGSYGSPPGSPKGAPGAPAPRPSHATVEMFDPKVRARWCYQRAARRLWIIACEKQMGFGAHVVAAGLEYQQMMTRLRRDYRSATR